MKAPSASVTRGRKIQTGIILKYINYIKDRNLADCNYLIGEIEINQCEANFKNYRLNLMAMLTL